MPVDTMHKQVDPDAEMSAAGSRLALPATDAALIVAAGGADRPRSCNGRNGSSCSS